MLSHYNSLWEVFTAFFSSMLLNDILGGIWTPEYKRNVSGLIKQMGIPFVSSLARKLSKQIDSNVKEISGHMHRRAIFMICFCVCILILAGAEQNEIIDDTCIKPILPWTVIMGFIIVCLGKYTFSKNIVTAFVCIFNLTVFFVLFYYNQYIPLLWEPLSKDKYLMGLLLFFLCIPIVWQIISCWIYSSLYYEILQSNLHREELLYKKAIIGLRTKQLDIIPDKYKVRAAVDLDAQANREEDFSYENCDDILYRSVDTLLGNPIPIKIFFSWIKCSLLKVFRGKNIDDFDFINNQFVAFNQISAPVSGLSHYKNKNTVISDNVSSHIAAESANKKPPRRYIRNAGMALCVGFISAVLYKLLKAHKN